MNTLKDLKRKGKYYLQYPFEMRMNHPHAVSLADLLNAQKDNIKETEKINGEFQIFFQNILNQLPLSPSQKLLTAIEEVQYQKNGLKEQVCFFNRGRLLFRLIYRDRHFLLETTPLTEDISFFQHWLQNNMANLNVTSFLEKMQKRIEEYPNTNVHVMDYDRFFEVQCEDSKYAYLVFQGKHKKPVVTYHLEDGTLNLSIPFALYLKELRTHRDKNNKVGMEALLETLYVEEENVPAHLLRLIKKDK